MFISIALIDSFYGLGLVSSSLRAGTAVFLLTFLRVVFVLRGFRGEVAFSWFRLLMGRPGSGEVAFDCSRVDLKKVLGGLLLLVAFSFPLITV